MTSKMVGQWNGVRALLFTKGHNIVNDNFFEHKIPIYHTYYLANELT